MKKLISLIAIMIFCVSACLAQDILVKKDGTTVLAKVLEVGVSDIKYKKHNNLDGPTYTISKSEVLSINYKNGTRDDLSKTPEEPKAQQPVVIVQNNNDSKVDYMRKQEIEDYYSKSRSLKTWSWILTGFGGLCYCSAIGILAGTGDKCMEEYAIPFWSSVGVGTICIVAGFPMRAVANNKKEIARRMSQASIPIQEIKIGNASMTPMLSMFNDRWTHDTSIGVGCNLRF